MIADARVLETEWVPQELHHREGQIQHLSAQLKPITHRMSAEDIIVTGPSGTGKTTIAKYVVEQLIQETMNVKSGYTNCISNSTRAAVVDGLVGDIGRGNDLRPEGTPTSVYFDRLREMDQHVVAIIDEVDVIEDDGVLHALHDLPNVTLLLICVSEDDLFTDLDRRVVSRLRAAAKISLDKYTHAELCDILDDRVNHALRAGVVDEGVVDYIADVSAGDARHAIALLRRAVREALADDEYLTVDDVEAVRQDAREEIHDRQVDTLGTHQRHLYEIIRRAGEIAADEMHQRYESRVADPKPKSTRRNYLLSLKRYDVIRTNGSGRGTRYELNRP